MSIFYDDIESSRGILNDSLKTFQESNPNVTVETSNRPGRHPFVKATFGAFSFFAVKSFDCLTLGFQLNLLDLLLISILTLLSFLPSTRTSANGYSYDWSLRNLSTSEVVDVLSRLSQRLGRKMSSFRGHTEPKTATASVQGQWHSGLFPPPLVFVNRKSSDAVDVYESRQSAASELARHPHAAHVQQALSDPQTLGKRLVPLVGGARYYGLTPGQIKYRLTGVGKTKKTQPVTPPSSPSSSSAQAQTAKQL